jgi:hypothetical protein
MESNQLAKILLTLGIILIVAAIVLMVAGNKLNWLGKLPGDIRIEKENVRIYVPITTMILLSVLVSAVIWIFKKLF